MDNEKTVKVWNLTTNEGRAIRVATIEQNGRKAAACEKCSAPCCRGSLLPVLNEDELRNHRFPVQFVAAPEWLQKQVPRAQFVAVLKMGETGCIYLDGATRQCKVFPDCPKSCLSYDCKDDDRMAEIWRTGALSREIEVTGNGELSPMQ